MSLWNRAQHFNELLQLYGDEFPLEIRHYLAPFIEDIVTLFSDSEIDISYARSIFYHLINEIESKADSYKQEDMLITLKLQKAAEMLKIRYQDDPLSLIAKLRCCLKKEYQRVHQQEYSTNTGEMGQLHAVVHQDTEILQHLRMLNVMTRKTDEILRKLTSDLETNLRYQASKASYLLQLSSIQSVSAPVMLQESQLNQKVVVFLSLQQMYKDTIDKIKPIQTIILEELIKWKNEQRLTEKNRSIYATELDNINKNCESLAEIIICNKNQIKECEKHWLQLPPTFRSNDNLFTSLKIHIMELLKNFAIKTFVIEKQPPQVLKINIKFEASASLLIGRILNFHTTNPQVLVTIINDSQAELLTCGQTDALNAGEVINNTEKMKYKPDHRFSASFCQLMLKNIKRSEKKGNVSVTDEKFVLLFQTQFLIDEEVPPIYVHTLSLPVVVIVAGSQEPHAWATIFWDNAFAEQVRIPFRVKERVLWPQVAKMLNMKFASVAGKGLSTEQLEFLASRAIRTDKPFNLNQTFLTWSEFCKEDLPDENFSFFEWFYRAMRLTRDYFQHLWKDNLIIGFTDKKDAENLLKACNSGTFLLRFSNTIKEGISIAWLHEELNDSGRKYVLMLYPYTPKDLAIRSLADRIADFSFLTHLYPNIPKDQVFGKYYSPEPSVKRGYIMSHLVSAVSGIPRSEAANISSINIPCSQTFASSMPSTSEQADSNIFNEYIDLSNLSNAFNDI